MYLKYKLLWYLLDKILEGIVTLKKRIAKDFSQKWVQAISAYRIHVIFQ